MDAKKIDLEKAYFGIVLWDFNADEPKVANLFGSIRVLTSVARWRVMDESETGRKNKKYIKEHSSLDGLSFCFGDTRGRVEYEMLCSDVVGSESVKGNKNVRKLDTWTLYVEPNRELLMEMVENMSITSCRRVLRKYAPRRTKK